MIRLTFMDADVQKMNKVFNQAAPKESGAFFELREGWGVTGRRLLAVRPIFPVAEDLDQQDNGILRPGARWISAAISHAINVDSGLIFVHSHPNPGNPLGFSEIDRASLASLEKSIKPLLNGPFAAAVVHPEG